ncbi:hypothetical protein FACS1894195_5160 [Bacteroidia bacterium]|nr:hypothetical protein FACS1894195_5160 [Bacteroidia bacterium]
MKEKQNIIKTIDNQLAEWRKKISKEIPERVGLAFYADDKGNVEVEVYFADENMWMSQQIMSNLFDVEEHTITYHLSEIYKSGELEEISTTRKIRVVRDEGKRKVNREIQFYNLDAIISVGYRVNSLKATQFRKFATRVLHEYIQKGFVINDDRFKNGNKFDESYFREMLERIREIRAERQLPTTMEQWIEFMGGFLKLNDYPILAGLGKISKEQADEKALAEYEEFRVIQDRNYVSDFEKLVKQVEK